MKKLPLFAVLLCAAGFTYANPVPPSDLFNAFDQAGKNIVNIMYFDETTQHGLLIVNGVITPPPPAGSPVLCGIAGNVSLLNMPTVFIDPDGSISDIIGVFPNQATGGLEVGFISDTEGVPILPPPAGLFIPEPVGRFDVSLYLDATLQQQGYTAWFMSDSDAPDAVATCGLLGLACACLGLMRRKA